MKIVERFPWQRYFILSIPFLFLLFMCTSCSSQKTIVNAVDEREANEILVFLASKDINANKVISSTGTSTGGGGPKIVLWDITVPPDQATEAMALLNQAGLPRRKGQNLLQLFSNVGLVPSEMQERIRYQAGLAEQIANTIRKIDGVLDAEVQISIPEENPLNPTPEKPKITASVYVKHNGVLDDPNLQLIPKIKRLVAASVPGLDYNNVTVIGDRVRTPVPYMPSGTSEAQQELVSVWTLVLAKDSVVRFQIVFFSFILLILLLILALLWVLWKITPLLEKKGGLHALFHIHPIESVPSEAEAKEEVKPPEEKKEEKGKADRDVDET